MAIRAFADGSLCWYFLSQMSRVWFGRAVGSLTRWMLSPFSGVSDTSTEPWAVGGKGTLPVFCKRALRGEVDRTDLSSLIGLLCFGDQIPCVDRVLQTSLGITKIISMVVHIQGGFDRVVHSFGSPNRTVGAIDPSGCTSRWGWVSRRGHGWGRKETGERWEGLGQGGHTH